MKITHLNCAIFGLVGQIISDAIILGFFSIWTFWILNGDVANIQRTSIHFGINIFALVFATYSVLMSYHLCYVIHRDFDSLRSYFWTRVHLIILGMAFFLLAILELSMYLEISNAPLDNILTEILDNKNVSAEIHKSTDFQSIFPEWTQEWQRKHKCCGIVSYKDYSGYGDKRSVSPDCCRLPKNIDSNSNRRGFKCGEGVLRMTFPFMQEIIFTHGCGAGIKESLINMSFYGFILSISTAAFITITALSYLPFLQEYSEELHRSRMKQYESEEKEQLKTIGKKQQNFRKHSGSKGGTIKAHGPKLYPSNASSHQHRSRSNSRSRNKTHVSETLERAQYQNEEKVYMKNVNDHDSFYNDNDPPHNTRRQKVTRNDPENRKHSASGRSGSKSSRSTSLGPINEKNRKSKHREEIATPDISSPGNPFELPPFQSNDNLFLNLIEVASSKKPSRNISSNTSSVDFQEDTLVPRVLLTKRKKSKQVIFDPNGNVYYTENEKEPNYEGNSSTKLLFTGNWESNNDSVEKMINNTTTANDQVDDEDLDPGDIIVRQLSKTDMRKN